MVTPSGMILKEMSILRCQIECGMFDGQCHIKLERQDINDMHNLRRFVRISSSACCRRFKNTFRPDAILDTSTTLGTSYLLRMCAFRPLFPSECRSRTIFWLS